MTIHQFAMLHRLKLRRDEDQTDIIPGKLGHIYEYSDDLLGVPIMPDPPQMRHRFPTNGDPESQETRL